VPFTLVHTGKYSSEDILKISSNTGTKHTPGKANNAKRSKTKLSWFSHLLPHSARKQGGLILHSASKPTWGICAHRVWSGLRENQSNFPTSDDNQDTWPLTTYQKHRESQLVTA